MTVNGRPHSADVQVRTLLSDFLREDLELTGTKVGCETSQCGACIVMLNGVSVKSCTVLAVQADGGDLLTIEGVATNGALAPLQDGFREMHGVQCGFCTPGMVISMADLIARNPNPTEAEIRAGLEGNLCRCTGYQNVVRAVQYAVAKTNSPVKMVTDTDAKKFYERQVAYLIAGDVDGLVDNNYHEDATFVAFDFTVRGREALKYQFGMYLRWIGLKEVVSTDKFTATDDSIFFEATVVTNRGIGRIFDVFMMRDGKISHHFTGVK